MMLKSEDTFETLCDVVIKETPNSIVWEIIFVTSLKWFIKRIVW